MKKTQNDHVCALCKHYREPFGYYDQMNRCAKTRRPVQDDSTCVNFERSGQLDMFIDINDETDFTEDYSEFI